MDSPIFGHQKSKQTIKNNYHTQQFQSMINTHNPPSSEWQLSKNKNTIASNAQLGNELKLVYVMLTMEKNFQKLLFKIAKCLIKKKYQAFKKIQQNFIISSSRSQRQHSLNPRHQVNNPQTTIFTQICIQETQQKLQIIFQIITRLQLKKLARAWRRIIIYSQKHRFSSSDNDSSRNIHTGSAILQQSNNHLGISSKPQSKKQLNLKKHAKQMKQNSLINNGKASDYQNQNQRLGQQLTCDEYNLEKFSAKMNNLLAYHESLLAMDSSDRETRLSDGKDCTGGSQNSFENHNHNHKPIQGTKSQVYTKKK